jgi:hypothetical protein
MSPLHQSDSWSAGLTWVTNRSATSLPPLSKRHRSEWRGQVVAQTPEAARAKPVNYRAEAVTLFPQCGRQDDHDASLLVEAVDPAAVPRPSSNLLDRVSAR